MMEQFLYASPMAIIIVGAFVLCCNCAADIFPSGEYEPRSDEYQKLLKKYQENL